MTPAPHRSRPHSRTRTVAIALAACMGSSLLVLSASAPALADDAVIPTSCDAAAVADGQQPVLQLSISPGATWQGVRPAYSFDDLAAVNTGFDRVGYCLETADGSGTKWAWAGMDAFTDDPSLLGLHAVPGQISQQRVNGLDVKSNVDGVATGTNMTGWLENWPNTYEKYRSGQVAGASSSSYDADDQPTTGWYGSFQIHRVNEEPMSPQAPSTVMAVNGFTTDGILDVGIGTASLAQAPEPDWTFAGNAGAFASRTLTVYARPAIVSFTAKPQDRQLFPQDDEGGANVLIRGSAASDVTSLRLTTVGDGAPTQKVQNGPDFAFDTRITAGLHDYDFLLEAKVDDTWRQVGHWTHIVAGDVYVIQGQSNAESAAWQDGSDSATENQSPWVRSFGSTAWNAETSLGNRAWQYAYGDMTSANKGDVTNAGMVGQWGMRMGGVLSQELGIPIAIINGAHGGQPIGVFQRNDMNPSDINTNYGRLYQRLEAAGVTDYVKGVLWYQGESDLGDTNTHINGFRALVEDWRADLGSALTQDTDYYAFQIRTSCGDNSMRENDIELREAQRNLPKTLGVTVLSTTGAPGHNGCHFDYEGGYKMFGEQAAAVLLRDRYGYPGANIAAPNPIAAAAASASSTELTIQLDSPTDVLTVDANINSTGDFVMHDSPAHVTDVAYREGGKLLVTLHQPVRSNATISYLSHQGAGPMIRTSTGVGLLAFNRMPVGIAVQAPELVPDLPHATAGAGYAEASGLHGEGAARYSVADGALPDGFTLNPTTGEVSGHTTHAGTTEVTIRMDSAAGHTTQGYAFTVDPAELVKLDLAASATTVTVGDPVEITAVGHDAFGNDLGDVTHLAQFTSDSATTLIEGNAMTFTTPGTHVVTATIDGVSESMKIQVQTTPSTPSPSPSGPPVVDSGDGGPGDGPVVEHAATVISVSDELAHTGSSPLPGALLALVGIGLGLAAWGATRSARRRRQE